MMMVVDEGTAENTRPQRMNSNQRAENKMLL